MTTMADGAGNPRAKEGTATTEELGNVGHSTMMTMTSWMTGTTVIAHRTNRTTKPAAEQFFRSRGIESLTPPSSNERMDPEAVAGHSIIKEPCTQT
jgi:hypothetical protein